MITPGPWHIGTPPPNGTFTVGTTEGKMTALCFTQSDARLVAAAPELLAALEALFDHCAMVHKHWGDGSNQREADEAIKAGRAALQKARGE